MPGAHGKRRGPSGLSVRHAASCCSGAVTLGEDQEPLHPYFTVCSQALGVPVLTGQAAPQKHPQGWEGTEGGNPASPPGLCALSRGTLFSPHKASMPVLARSVRRPPQAGLASHGGLPLATLPACPELQLPSAQDRKKGMEPPGHAWFSAAQEGS